MRQLLTRIDDDLHRRLKERARDQGRSVNALVTEILEEAVQDESPREGLRRRLAERGMLAEIEAPKDVPSLEEVLELLRGDAGRAVLEGLEETRADRL